MINHEEPQSVIAMVVNLQSIYFPGLISMRETDRFLSEISGSRCANMTEGANFQMKYRQPFIQYIECLLQVTGYI